MRRIVSPLQGLESPLGARAIIRWILSNGFWRDENVWLDREEWSEY